ncbi:hypothetical protein AAG570_012052 [Ranatra chinensis]|uniref:Uncharacterized protein n=1 Tax=Ranatra chinensis TaxID=642074 RepID=A0ABD0YHP5_9HEMI
MRDGRYERRAAIGGRKRVPVFYPGLVRALNHYIPNLKIIPINFPPLGPFSEIKETLALQLARGSTSATVDHRKSGSAVKGDEEGGALSRWLRELRGESKHSSAQHNNNNNQQNNNSHQQNNNSHQQNNNSHQQNNNRSLDRNNPIYHSEGKGLRSKKAKDKRRHSFNQHPDNASRDMNYGPDSTAEDGYKPKPVWTDELRAREVKPRMPFYQMGKVKATTYL